MKYDVWAANDYDDTDMNRVGEHMDASEVAKMIKKQDIFDCMYRPMICEENTMNEVTDEFTGRAQYILIKCEVKEGETSFIETVEGTYQKRSEADAAMKAADKGNKTDLWRLYYDFKMRIA